MSKSKIVDTDTNTIIYKSSVTDSSKGLLYGKSFFIWMLIGLALIVFGMILMLGGHMPSPDVWDDSLIYSARRTVIAPIFMIAGLIVEIYAIFKK